MPLIPNPDDPGEPGGRGREAESPEATDTRQGTVDRTRPEAASRQGGWLGRGRQPSAPGQPARYMSHPGDRDRGTPPSRHDR